MATFMDYVSDCNDRPLLATHGAELTTLQQYVCMLSEYQWMAFQSHERTYRDCLNTKCQHEKNVASSGDSGKCITLLTLVNGIFLKNGVFSAESQSSKLSYYDF